MSQVHPDLVGAPRFQRQLQEAMLPALLQHLKMGNSLLATCHHLTAVGLQGIPAYRQIDGTLREFCLQQSHITRDNCLILAVQTACCQGSFQLCLHLRAFGEQHAAGSIPVQAVQRPDCHHLPLDLEIMCQIIGKGAGAGLPGRMHQHPGRLVQHNHLIVLVENDIIVECKAVDKLVAEHRQQLWNYMRLTGKQIGILWNFAPPMDQAEHYYLDTKDGVMYMF